MTESAGTGGGGGRGSEPVVQQIAFLSAVAAIAACWPLVRQLIPIEGRFALADLVRALGASAYARTMDRPALGLACCPWLSSVVRTGRAPGRDRGRHRAGRRSPNFLAARACPDRLARRKRAGLLALHELSRRQLAAGGDDAGVLRLPRWRHRCPACRQPAQGHASARYARRRIHWGTWRAPACPAHRRRDPRGRAAEPGR